MKFNKTTLKNGVRLITIPMIDNPSIAVLVMVEAGSKYENKKNNGISHFLEHMVFKGTPKRPKMSDISRELDGIGAHYNAFTGQEVTGYWVKADARHLDTALDVVSDMYLNPLFDEKEIEKEKGVIIEEMRMYRDLPQRHVHDVLSELMHGDQPAGWNIIGTEENIRSFSRDSFVSYRNDHYVGSATIVTVAGSFDEKDIIDRVEKAFIKISTVEKKGKLPVKESQKSPAVKTEYKETDQTHLVIAVRTFSIHDPRIPAMQVLSTILGGGMSSRLFTKMRDELGICYYIRASNDPFTDHGDLTISAGVDNGRVEIAVKEILAACAQLKTKLVGQAELKKAKDYIAGTTLLELETSEARAEFAGGEEILKGKIESPEEHISKVNAVTAADIQRLAQEIFVDSGLNLALVGRAKTEKLSPLLSFTE
ncbi:MAG: pitrilysin family protein [Candidatus Taylorbacteria bacterium]|nr:pitrilysin family protein [Candidatus Taylorbacteria bacterium]